MSSRSIVSRRRSLSAVETSMRKSSTRSLMEESDRISSRGMDRGRRLLIESKRARRIEGRTGLQVVVEVIKTTGARILGREEVEETIHQSDQERLQGISKDRADSTGKEADADARCFEL